MAARGARLPPWAQHPSRKAKPGGVPGGRLLKPQECLSFIPFPLPATVLKGKTDGGSNPALLPEEDMLIIKLTI